MNRLHLATAVPLLALLASICLVDCGGDDNVVTGEGGSAGMGGASATGGAPGAGGAAGAGGVHADGATAADASSDGSADASSADGGTGDASLDVAPLDVLAGDVVVGDVVDAAADRASNDAAVADAVPADALGDMAADGAAVVAEGSSADAASEARDDALPNSPDATPDVAPPVVDAAPETSTADAGPDATATPGEAAADAPPAEASDGGVTFAQVVAFFSAPAEHCTDCHVMGANRIDLTLAPAALYTLLTSPLPNNREGTCGGGGPDGGNRTPIVPGSLETSFLWLKITGTQPGGCGARMPLGCDPTPGAVNDPCLVDADTQIIRDWILEGAPGP